MIEFSVCIPAYRAEDTLNAAIQSVVDQHYSHWKVFIVEDGAETRVASLVEQWNQRFPGKFHYESFTERKGVSAARNRLLEIATGDAVAFLDADDLWWSEYLENVNQEMTGGADIVVTPIQLKNLESGIILGTYQPEERLIHNPVQALYESSVIMTSSGVSLTRNIIDKVGCFNTQLEIGEDRDYWLRAALLGAKFSIAPVVAVTYYKHRMSAMAQTMKVARDTLKFYEHYLGDNRIPLRLRRRQLASACKNYGLLIRQNDHKTAFRNFLRAWKIEPWRIDCLVRASISLMPIGRITKHFKG